ncbi:MAG: hypothetical protein EAZ47_09040 [Bacteroidetes bacterium]|nr:MAG: hypothetical protein EAY72_07670 [Bacteroidota bacterium]TAE59490.1 MAG: hypothetical protein EAY68_10775 [Bacteroidota bacterium]TAF92253.1 MAG: hypothetical protein EAZ47_09040 [Bacteroidota bacterium]
MPHHEQLICERCNKAFVCKPGNITQCACFGVVISPEVREQFASTYTQCICIPCIQELANKNIDE